MKICYLADAPYVHTRRWVDHFVAEGHECEVISFRPAEIPGARVHFVGGFESLGKARYLIKAKEVRRLVQESAPDVVHALHLTSYGFLAALADVHPLVLSAWGTDILWMPRFTPFHRWITRYALGKADEITATGLHLATETARFLGTPCDVRVVPYGVDFDRFTPAPERAATDTVVIGTAARLSEEKGIGYLIEAMGHLPACDNRMLRIAGDGPLMRKLIARADDVGVGQNVDFLGWVEHEALPGFLQGLDIFVLPSLTESFGVAAIEAAAVGLPVIASRVDGVPDVVIDGVTGLLVPPGDPQALAEAIESLVHDPERRKRMGAAGRELVRSQYDWSENAAQMGRIYDALLARRTPAAVAS